MAYYFEEKCRAKGGDWSRVRVMAIIHDSVVVSCPKCIVVKASRLLYNCLANPAQFEEFTELFGDFPFDSSVEVGYRWGSTIQVYGDDKPKELNEWDVLGGLKLAGDKDRKEIEEWQKLAKKCPSKEKRPRKKKKIRVRT